MNTNLTLVSATFATLASICFVSGVLILSGERGLGHGQA